MACHMLSHQKKPTRNSMATMGTLSGFLTIWAKFASSIDTPRKATAARPRAPMTLGRQTAVYFRDRKRAALARVMKSQGAVRALTVPLRSSAIAVRSLFFLQRPRDAAVLAH